MTTLTSKTVVKRCTICFLGGVNCPPREKSNLSLCIFRTSSCNQRLCTSTQTQWITPRPLRGGNNSQVVNGTRQSSLPRLSELLSSLIYLNTLEMLIKKVNLNCSWTEICSTVQMRNTNSNSQVNLWTSGCQSCKQYKSSGS
jgi:hypothetical protein